MQQAWEYHGRRLRSRGECHHPLRLVLRHRVVGRERSSAQVHSGHAGVRQCSLLLADVKSSYMRESTFPVTMQDVDASPRNMHSHVSANFSKGSTFASQIICWITSTTQHAHALQGIHGPRRICFHSDPNLTVQKSRAQTPSNPMQEEFSPPSSNGCYCNSMRSTCVFTACVDRFCDRSQNDGFFILCLNIMETITRANYILTDTVKQSNNVVRAKIIEYLCINN